jgi:endonuclease/exonuclease/phosphatase (EEP) superfamily protein YafD
MTKNPQWKSPVSLLFVTLGYGVLLAALTIMNLGGGDRWWFGDLNLFLPQAIWGIPAIFLAVAAFRRGGRLVCLPILYLAWTVVPIMGLCWPLHKEAQVDGARAFRCMTWNIKAGSSNPRELLAEIDRQKPDVVFLQEVGNSLRGPLGGYLKGWNVKTVDQYIVASRLPLTSLEERKIFCPGENRPCLRCQVRFGEELITLYNIHFLSPRDGLHSFSAARWRPWLLPAVIRQLESNVLDRVTQSYALSEMVAQEEGPVLVAGDFNSADSAITMSILRKGGLHDAFAEGGRGYGYTYGHDLLQRTPPGLRFSWMRIDHIMMSRHLRTVRSWTGTDKASDHRPVIADLTLLRQDVRR